MASRYTFMRDSKVQGTDGTAYKDPLIFSNKGIRLENDPAEYSINSVDVERFDLLIAKTYGRYNIFKDLVLQLNNISYQWDLNPEDKLLFPEKEDLERFIRGNRE